MKKTLKDKPVDSINDRYEKKPSTEKQDSENVQIKMGKVDSIIIYQVKESELEILEKGSPQGIYINLLIFFLSIGISFLISVLTTDLSNKPLLFNIFIIIIVCCFAFSIVLGSLYMFARNAFKETLKLIKSRVQ